MAIELVLTLRLAFDLALRQAEAFSRGVLRLLGLALPVPDHSTLSRRGQAFAGRQPRVLASTGPIHLALDSTGLKLFEHGEWHAEKHGRARRPPARSMGCPYGGSPAAMARASSRGRCRHGRDRGARADDAAEVPTCSGRLGV